MPYIAHKDDLRQIAPWFREYIKIMKGKEEVDKSWANQCKGIQMGWGTEMFGYIFGAAYVGIRHKVARLSRTHDFRTLFARFV